MVSLATAFYRRSTVLYAEIAKFGIVGATAAVIDLGGAAGLHGVAGLGPLTAKVISTLVATVYSYLGNRFWAFRDRANHSLPREWLVFFALNGVGLLIALSAIAVTEYGLGIHSQLSYNAAQILGTGLATLFRFWAYRKWVFLAPPAPVEGALEAMDLAIAGPGGQGR
jgi:putative flippase GtrA